MTGPNGAALALLDASYALARPALFRLEPERAHELVLRLLSLANSAPALVPAARRLLRVDDPRLAVEAFGLRFPNAIGLAAGLDKNGVALVAWAALGFGHVEVGTVTPRPQPGQPRPRVFRLPRERALINRMGFPSEGAEVVARRLASRPRGLGVVVGGNVGKAATTPLDRAADDYREAAEKLLPHVDYVAANISSPNTVGLRALQAPEQVAAILKAIRPIGTKPVLLKLAPDIDLGAIPEIVASARSAGAAGLVGTNTTVERAGLVPATATGREVGGLSGPPLRRMTLRFVEHLAKEAGPDLPVVAVGGAASPSDVRDFLTAGARLVQVSTSFVYAGPALAARLAWAPLG